MTLLSEGVELKHSMLGTIYEKEGPCHLAVVPDNWLL